MDERWKELSSVRNTKSHQVPGTWTLDKYPNAPTLKPHSTVVLFDQDGPGVITHLHVSKYERGDDKNLILRVWYDGEDQPSIEMPLTDFMGDIGSSVQPYQTVFFSRVRRSRNFRLPMPFREHIRIVIENPTDSDFLGYSAVQWDEVSEMPSDIGYLRTVFQHGSFKFPHEELKLCSIKGPGTLIAHWLSLEGDHPSCANGQGICEGNHEIYLDDDPQPTLESLGAEDFYGHSWGFGGLETDGYNAIVQYEETPAGGTRVALVRARDIDRISFRSSCNILFTYRHDLGPAYNPETGKGKAPALQPFVKGDSINAPYASCVYYYAM